MKISLATNFDDDLIDKVKNYNIYEIYGRMKDDFMCGGRPNNSTLSISNEIFERHVKKVRDAGINFNYLFNGACSGNSEQNPEWQAQFVEFLTYLNSVGVNAYTVTNPLILKIIKKHFPDAICRISTFACVDTVEKARYWESMGADIICADFVKINRDFETLKAMNTSLKTAKIELLATNSCIKYCPYIHTHVNCIAHASSTNNQNSNYIDWCLLECQHKELKNPEEYIKSPWIRPEDVPLYEEIGIEHLKITERDFPTEILLKRVEAYSNHSYDGNLLDLIQGHGYILEGTALEPLEVKTNFNDINEVVSEIFKIRGFKLERKYPQHVYIDNKKLDGFIDFFKQGNCKGNCQNCNYCSNISKKTITTNEEVSNYLKDLYGRFENMLY